MVKNNDVMKKYTEALNDFIKVTVDYFKTFLRKDKEKKYTLQDDVKVFFNKYKGKFSDFFENEKKKSSLFEILYQCSPKMITSIFYILKSPGSVLFYSNFVNAEGLQLFKIYLQFFGFIYLPNDENFSEKKITSDQKKDFFRFVEFHGGIDTKIRLKNKNLFNNPENKKGKIAKIILISPAGSEGINLKNVRQVHILEPFWNEVRIEQMIGRAIRQCSHADLPMNERNVTVYRFKMVRKNKKETTDEKMEDISRRKNNLIQSFLEAIREVAVDCELFKSHNMMATEYKCFKFTEDSLLKKPIGPAYTKKIDFDIRLNDGSNTSNSNRIKVKVRKIKAIKRIDDKTFSEEFFCWIYDKTGVVYDLDLHYPIGRVKFDDQGNLEK